MTGQEREIAVTISERARVEGAVGLKGMKERKVWRSLTETMTGRGGML